MVLSPEMRASFICKLRELSGFEELALFLSAFYLPEFMHLLCGASPPTLVDLLGLEQSVTADFACYLVIVIVLDIGN